MCKNFSFTYGYIPSGQGVLPVVVGGGREGLYLELLKNFVAQSSSNNIGKIFERPKTLCEQ